jgi:hypothetical protein
VLFLLVALAAAIVLVALARGGYQDYPRSALVTAAGRRTAPTWTRPCWATARWATERICAHVEGRVVWIQRHDPDGDGDRHLIVVEGLRPRIVKVPATLPVSHLPGRGRRIDAVGFIAYGASGKREIVAMRLVPGGPTGR